MINIIIDLDQVPILFLDVAHFILKIIFQLETAIDFGGRIVARLLWKLDIGETYALFEILKMKSPLSISFVFQNVNIKYYSCTCTHSYVP